MLLFLKRNQILDTKATPSDLDSPDEAKLNNRHRLVFWTHFILFAFGIFWAFEAMVFTVDVAFQTHLRIGNYITFVYFAAATVALQYATRVCNRRGLSEASVREEEIRRAVNDETNTSIEPLEVRSNPTALFWFIALGCGTFSGILFLMVRMLHSVPGTEVYGYSAAAFFGLFAFLRQW